MYCIIFFFNQIHIWHIKYILTCIFWQTFLVHHKDSSRKICCLPHNVSRALTGYPGSVWCHLCSLTAQIWHGAIHSFFTAGDLLSQTWRKTMRLQLKTFITHILFKNKHFYWCIKPCVVFQANWTGFIFYLYWWGMSQGGGLLVQV